MEMNMSNRHNQFGAPPEEPEDALERWRRLREGRGAPPHTRTPTPKLGTPQITYADIDARIAAAVEAAITAEREHTDALILDAVKQLVAATSEALEMTGEAVA